MKKFFNSREQISFYDKAVNHPESCYINLIKKIILSESESFESFLDIGSGTGALGISLKDKYSRIDLVDSSKYMCEIARNNSKNYKNINVINCNFCDYNTMDKLYDFITSIHVSNDYFLDKDFIKKIISMKKGKALFCLLKPYKNKFYSDELYPLLFGRKKNISKDKFKIIPFIDMLVNHKIDFKLKNIEFKLVQEFDNFDEAVKFWKLYFPPNLKYDEQVLYDFLGEKLVRANTKGDKYLYENKVESVVIVF